MKKDMNNIHDKSYKALFSNKDIFLNLINDFTEEQWKKEITTDNLTLVNKSFILADYEEVEADIVYQAEIEGQKVIFYVLLEFQSSVDHSMPIRLLMYMIEIWREVLRGVSKEEIKRKDFRLPAIVPIVTYNGKDKWSTPLTFKEKVTKYKLFGDNLLDFEYVLLDVNRYAKEVLLEKESISSAIFLLDQKVDYEEYMNRLATIVKAFNKLTPEEKLELKNWLANTLSEGIKDVALSILDADKEEVDKMTANITRTIEEMKEDAKIEEKLEIAKKMLLSGMDIEIIISITELEREKIEQLEIKG
ncbi:MAG: Rpn family recombination-promoting nuclease/putative transposase [Cellulosilyticaceae bacterium]